MELSHPCPICGRQVDLIVRHSAKPKYGFMCDCGLQLTWFDSETLLLAAWNSRPGFLPLQAGKSYIELDTCDQSS